MKATGEPSNLFLQNLSIFNHIIASLNSSPFLEQGAIRLSIASIPHRDRRRLGELKIIFPTIITGNADGSFETPPSGVPIETPSEVILSVQIFLD